MTASINNLEGGKRARAKGVEALDQLKKGATVSDLTWSKPLVVGRSKPESLQPTDIEAAFRVSAAQLPAYVGVEDPSGGYTIVKLMKVIDAPAPDDAQVRGFAQQLRGV